MAEFDRVHDEFDPVDGELVTLAQNVGSLKLTVDATHDAVTRMMGMMENRAGGFCVH